MKKSIPEAIGETGGANNPQDYQSGGVAFAAPLDSRGTGQKQMKAHIIVLPGGLVLVDTGLNISLGTVASGPIECKNGRN